MRILFAVFLLVACIQCFAAVPDVTLQPVYHSYQLGTCQYYGFSFDDSYAEMKQMRDLGANTVSTVRLWVPIQDPKSPDGNGFELPDRGGSGLPLAQSFSVKSPFTGVAISAPTWGTDDSGLTLVLYALGDKDSRREIGRRTFAAIRDNDWLSLEFPAQPAGKYLIEAIEPTGTRVGVWAVRGDEYRDGQAYLGGKATSDLDFKLRVRYEGGDYGDLWPFGVATTPVMLGRSLWESLQTLDMNCAVAVGDWNNGFFPYYPDWWYEKYPEFCMLDQYGKKFEATMFDVPKGWPSIDHPEQIEGCARFVTTLVATLKNERIPMWVLGGEELYPTYCFPDRQSDYGMNSITHFREWCRQKYREVGRLNSAWSTNYKDFDELEPPRAPSTDVRWLDWIDFRYRAMAERYVCLYQAVIRGDESRLALTANHGDVYDGLAAPRMGMQPDLYAQVSDGFETGQIVYGEDPYYFNLMYADSLNSQGKPVSPNRLAYKYPDPRARGGGRSYTREKLRRYTYESVGSGAWYLGLLQWRGSLPDGEWGMKGTEAIEEARKVFAELAKLQPYLLHSYPVRPPLGIYVSRPTWSLYGFDAILRRLHVALVERQMPKSFLYDDTDWTGYRAVLSANNRIVSSASVRKIRSYVENGGTFIVYGRFAETDETLKPLSDAVFERAQKPVGVPGLAWVAKMGKGMVVWLSQSTDDTLADDICRLLDDLDIRRPTTVEAERLVTRSAEIQDGTKTQVPHDLSGVRTLGQTFVAPGAFKSVRFSTPTYRSRVSDYSLTARIRKDGPEGEVLGEVTIPPAELSDNSWHEVRTTSPVAKGTRLYLEITSPSGLPANHIGIWTASDDWYRDGQLYADGKPVSGDMCFHLSYDEETTASRAMEAFTLTDGLNFVQVLVNTSASRIKARVALDGELAPNPSAYYHVKDMVSGKYIGRLEADSLAYSLELGPHETAAVVLSADVSETQASKAVRAATDAAARWKNLPVQYALTYCASAQSALKQGKCSKAQALASRATTSFAISANASRKADGLAISASVYDYRGNPVADADVEAMLTPAFGLRVKLRHAGGGKYTAMIETKDFPMMYDYRERRYRPLTGPVSIDITARRKTSVGAVRIHSAI